MGFKKISIYITMGVEKSAQKLNTGNSTLMGVLYLFSGIRIRKELALDMPIRMKITTYEEAFKLIGVPFPLDKRGKNVIKSLEEKGHTEKSICFAIWKENEYLSKAYVYKSNFWPTFEKCIKQWSWPAGDPRWDTYWAKKKELKKAREKQDTIKAERRDKVFKKRYNDEVIGFIYFIQGENGGPIKIGYTKDIEQRLKELQTGYPDILKLLIAFPGNHEYEKALHRQLKLYRLNGEWFKPDPAVFRKINELSAINKELKQRRPKTKWEDYC